MFNNTLYMGVVENRYDPLQIGRYQVRVAGVHSASLIDIPSDKLPWATPINPITSASMNGIGSSPSLVEGSVVIIMFMDTNFEIPMILGSIAGIPDGYSQQDIQTNVVSANGTSVKLEDTSQLRVGDTLDGYNFQEDTKITNIQGNTISVDKPVVSPAPSPVLKTQSSDIRVTPPPNSTQDQNKATENIKLLIKACELVGLNTREQKCAVLAICGGESRWLSVEENYNYKPNRLKTIFSFATASDLNTYSNAIQKGISRQQFFSWAYGTTKRGNGFLGNKNDSDGGLYYGRGLLQITGRYNYKRYTDQLKSVGINVDLIANPSILISDAWVSAVTTTLYIKDRTKETGNFFFSAVKAVGHNSADILELKTSYYNYFLKQDISNTSEGVNPVDKSPSLIKDNRSNYYNNSSIGFRDLNNKYPLKDHLGEPDINRLARSVLDDTIVPLKQKKRHVGVPMSNGEWSQPEIPYNPKYPFNQVKETESGHIIELDDTPANERVHIYHRKGTYFEIDANGTQVNYIVGDDYSIVENNKCVHVVGACNITVDGDVNILARSDANIQVANNVELQVGNNLNMGIRGDINQTVDGNLNLQISGSYNIKADKINTISNQYNNQSSDITFKSNNLFMSGGVLNSTFGGIVQASDNFQVKTGAFPIQASSITVAVPIIQGAVDIEDPSKGNDILPHETSVNLEILPPIFNNKDFLVHDLKDYNEQVHETVEDFDSPSGRDELHKLKGQNKDFDTEEEYMDIGGNTNSNILSDKTKVNEILSQGQFNASYPLSKNINLGMMFDGGFNNKHKLVDQYVGGTLYKKQDIVNNLYHLCNNIIEPLIDKGVLQKGQWRINSGFRQGNNSRSQHNKGQAVDIGIFGGNKFTKTFDIIKQIEKLVNYDQLILEYRYPNSCWIHISFNPKGNRKQAFTMINDIKTASGFSLISKIPSK